MCGFLARRLPDIFFLQFRKGGMARYVVRLILLRMYANYYGIYYENAGSISKIVTHTTLTGKSVVIPCCLVFIYVWIEGIVVVEGGFALVRATSI